MLLHYPDPPKGISRKLYTPWRGIYTIVEKRNDLIYKLRKKGGRIKTAPINRIKYYDPENSDSDKDTRTKKMKIPKHNPRDLRPAAERAHYPRQLIDSQH